MMSILQVEVFCMIPVGSEKKVQVKIDPKLISVRLQGEAESWLVKGSLLQAVEVHLSSWFIGKRVNGLLVSACCQQCLIHWALKATDKINHQQLMESSRYH